MATKSKAATVKETKAKIQVFAPGYRSRKTSTQLVAPGVYDYDDPTLYGVAQDIVNAGAGAWVDSKRPVKSIEDDEAIEQSPTLAEIHQMNREQLLAHAAAHQIEAPATGDTDDDWRGVILDFWGF